LEKSQGYGKLEPGKAQTTNWLGRKAKDSGLRVEQVSFGCSGCWRYLQQRKSEYKAPW